MEIFKLLGTIAVNNSEAVQSFDETSSKGESLKTKMSTVFSKVGSAAVACGKTIATGLAAGSAAMVALTTKALNAAGELEQNMGGSEAVFKEYATGMQETANSAFQNMGLSASDFLATANKMGALFQGSGISIEKSADLSSQAMQRAADVASIMGIDISAAMESIAGAAKGNFTMMDNLGVAMNDTTLQAYALEKGISKSTQQMTNQEKITLAMEMFMEKTAYAAGNYAKENKTLAGSLTTAKAAMMNFLSGAGNVDGLVKSLVNAGEVIGENLQTLLPRLVEGLNELIDELMPFMPEMVENLLPSIIDGAVALFNGVVRALPSLLQIIIRQIPNIASQITAALVETFPVLLETVKQLFGQIFDYISISLLGTGVNFETAFAKIQQIFSSLWVAMQEIWFAIGEPIFNAISTILETVYAVFAARMPEIQAFASECFSGIKKFWEEHLKPCFEAIGDFLENVLAPAFNWVFNNIIVPIIDKAFNKIISLWNLILKPALTAIIDFITGVFSFNITDAIDGLRKTFEDIIDFLATTFTEGFKNAFEGIWKIIKGILNNIFEGFETWINGIINAVNDLLESLNDMAEEVGEKVGLEISIPTIDRVHLPRLARGGVLEKGQVGLLEGSGAEAVVPLENNRKWINAVAEDMNSAVGGSEEIRELKAAFEEFVADLPEIMVEAFAQMQLTLNNREFGRLVKAVK